MSTRLVERLEREIAQAEDPMERECLKAQRAAVIARLGMLDQAKFTLAGLRTQSRRHGQPRLQAWVHFVDGSIHYFSAAHSARSLRGFQEARDAALKSGDTRLQALASAWLAAAKMQCGRDAALLDVLGEAFRLAAPDDHATLSRAWLVLANMADYGDRFDESMRCYDRVRTHAVADGDSTAVSLMMYNRANSLISHHVRRELFGTATATAVERVLAEIESTANLDWGLGNTALASFAQVVRAEALTVVGRWAEAIALIDQYLDRHMKETSPASGARFLAHRAWCHANLQHNDQAQADAEATRICLPKVTDADDLAVAHQRLANTFKRLGQPERAQTHEEAAAVALQALSAEQAGLGILLNQFKQTMQELGHPWLPV